MQTNNNLKLNKRIRETKIYKFIIRPALLLILAGIIITGGILYCIFDKTDGTELKKSDAMIVLGCQIWGASPSPMLLYRLEKALDVYKKGYADYIIVSGGQGKDEQYTEAYIMKEWLKKNGVDGNIIIEETKATSTFENIKYSQKIMEDRKLNTAIIVSSEFHMFRSLRLAKRLDLKAYAAPAPTVEHLKPYYFSREIIGVVKSFFLDR